MAAFERLGTDGNHRRMRQKHFVEMFEFLLVAMKQIIGSLYKVFHEWEHE